MEQTIQRRCCQRMILTFLTILCGAFLTLAQAANDAADWPEVLTLAEAAKYLRLDSAELEKLALREVVPGRRIGTQWRFNRAALLAWLNGDWELIVTAVSPTIDDRTAESDVVLSVPGGTVPMADETIAQVTATGTTLTRAEASPTDEKVSSESIVETPAPDEKAPEEPIGEAPKERTAEDVFLRGQRVLLRPGEVVLDTGLFYAESNSRGLALFNDNTELATFEAETRTAFLLARYGLFDETELFASTAYLDQDFDVFVGNQRLAGSSDSRFDDVRVGGRRTVMREGIGRPDVILTLTGRVRSDDGKSSYSAGGGIALVKSLDPVVLFANTNYLHNFSQDFGDVIRLEPEDRIDATLGYAYSLNDTITLSSAVSGLFLSETEFDNVTFRRQNLFSLQFGLTSWLAKGLYIEPSVSFGLNNGLTAGNSFVIGTTLAYTFDP